MYIHSVCRHEDSYRGKRVVIVGVGNTACDAAVDLSGVCSQVAKTKNKTFYATLNCLFGDLGLNG